MTQWKNILNIVGRFNRSMTSTFLEKLKKGDNDAYKLLYREHYRILCVVAYEFVHDRYTAETIVNDVIFNIWENRESFYVNYSMRSYLVKAVRNRCINHIEYTHRQERLKESVHRNIDQQQKNYKEQREYPLCELLEKELENKIEQSIDSLPIYTRNVFLLSRNENLTYEEIAEKTESKVSTVKYHIKLALDKLRHDLKDYIVFILVTTYNFTLNKFAFV